MLITLLSGCGTDTTSGQSPQATTPTGGGKGGAQAVQAGEQLKGLRVMEGNAAGYDRDRFGQRWKDTDRNGCDQRNDILARDLGDIEKKDQCTVLSGRLRDPYTGTEIAFTRSRPAEVQIDHVYPLALAWRMGAADWSEDRREEFANDHDNLLAVQGRANQQKGDSGPGEWKPQESYQCTYAIKYIAVAQEYGLPVTRTDHTALGDFLTRC